MDYFKDFDRWNNVKKRIDQRIVDESVFYHEREIWWCSLGLNIGIESNGKNELFERPVLILKVFNKDMIWCLSVGSTLKESPYYHKVSIDELDRSVMVTQFKTIDSKRLLRKLASIDEGDFEEIKYTIISILKNETPTLGGGISEAEATNTLSIRDEDIESQEEREVD